MPQSHRKRSAIGVVAVILLLVGGAYAYWTISGSGTGSATTGDVTAITVNQITELDPMYPGDSAQTISGDFTNANAGPVYVGTVTASIDSVTQAEGAVGTCTAADYTLTGAAMTVNAEVASGTDVGTWTGATLQFNNTATNQDGCKGATVNLAYAIS